MSVYERMSRDYDKALTPDELTELGLIMLDNASVQDGEVGKAAQALQALEATKRSNLEKYLMAIEEGAKADAEKQVNFASRRLDTISNQLALLATSVGMSKDKRDEMQRLTKEREQILKAFPQLGFAADEYGGVDGQENSVDLSGLIERNDAVEWRDFVKSGSLADFAKLYDENLGIVPQDLESMIRYKIGQSNELTDKLKTDPMFRAIAHLSQGTLADSQKEAQGKAKAATNAAVEKDNEEKLKAAKSLFSQFLSINDRAGLQEFARRHPELKKSLELLKKNNNLNYDEGMKKRLAIVGLN